ncbi:hypothetical protein V1281_001593 [Nitrobacteraceae bacterium AZCC 2161]
MDFLNKGGSMNVEQAKAKALEGLVNVGLGGIRVAEIHWPDVWRAKVYVVSVAEALEYSIWVTDYRGAIPYFITAEGFLTLDSCVARICEKLESTVGAPKELAITGTDKEHIEAIARANELFEEAFRVLRQCRAVDKPWSTH